MNLLQVFTYATAQLFSSFLFAQSFNSEKDVMFLLRVRGRNFSDEEIFKYSSRDSIKGSSFDPSKPTTFFVHGFQEDRNIEHHLKLSQILLDGKDQNLFFVDWGKGSKAIFYPDARNRVPEVARTLGEFINYMTENAGLNTNDVTLFGFSLGAHIVGLAGKSVRHGKINSVIGLDPAGPLFDANEMEGRINPEAADYTECIHTGYFFGIREPICKTDFYVNGGMKQPGCLTPGGIDNIICSHCRVLWLLAESIQNPKAFYGKRCENYQALLNDNCNEEPGAYMFDPDNLAKGVSGIFHVKTNKKSPFSRSNE